MHRLILRHLPDLNLPWPQRFGLATAIMAVAVAARWLLLNELAAYPLLTFWPAVFLVALLLDGWAGLYAIALSVLAAFWFAEPPDSIVPHRVQDILAIVFFGGVCGGLAVIAEGLRSALRTVARAEAEKDLLLREIYHRIGNDLQRIGAMLTLTARRVGPEHRDEFDSTAERLRVLGWVYASLRRVEGNAVMPVRPFLVDMVKALTKAHGSPQVACRIDIGDAMVSLERASGLAIVLNELLTNACKHAFPDGRTGCILVRFRRRGKCKVLIVQDDGVGRPATAGTGLGMVLVEDFVARMDGRMKVIDNRGTRVCIVVPVEKSRGGVIARKEAGLNC